MKKRHLWMPMLLSALLLVHPVHAAAMEEVILPACEYPLRYDVGALEIHFGSDLNGARMIVYSIENEGTFAHYKYDVRLADASMMHCDLKEGDYELVAELPSTDGKDTIILTIFSFTIKDPDMDIDQSFDKTELQCYLTVDPTITENVKKTSEETMEERASLSDPEKKERWICQQVDYSIARRNYQAGDLNADGAVNASDAALTLIAAANIGAGGDSGLTAMQSVEADVTGDAVVNASDATLVLMYAAAHSAGSFSGDMLDFARIRMGR